MGVHGTMEKEGDIMVTLPDLAKALLIDKSYLCKLAKKLGINEFKVRGKHNKWTTAYRDDQIEKILTHRKGIPHKLKKTAEGYKYKEST